MEGKNLEYNDTQKQLLRKWFLLGKKKASQHIPSYGG
jgi:hypothetical protein